MDPCENATVWLAELSGVEVAGGRQHMETFSGFCNFLRDDLEILRDDWILYNTKERKSRVMLLYLKTSNFFNEPINALAQLKFQKNNSIIEISLDRKVKYYVEQWLY